MTDHRSGSEFRTRVDEPKTRLQYDPPTWCVACGMETRMILAEKAAVICRCSRRKIYRWIEDGGLHFAESDDGEVFVCGPSLSRKLEELDSTTDGLRAPASGYETCLSGRPET